LAEKGFLIDRRDITLPENIRSVGDYTFTVKLHHDVVAKLTLEVVAG
jgi:large subunit ribosomal protein L9